VVRGDTKHGDGLMSIKTAITHCQNIVNFNWNKRNKQVNLIRCRNPFLCPRVTVTGAGILSCAPSLPLLAQESFPVTVTGAGILSCARYWRRNPFLCPLVTVTGAGILSCAPALLIYKILDNSEKNANQAYKSLIGIAAEAIGSCNLVF